MRMSFLDMYGLFANYLYERFSILQKHHLIFLSIK